MPCAWAWWSRVLAESRSTDLRPDRPAQDPPGGPAAQPDPGDWGLFDLVPDGILVIGGDGIIRFANRQAEELLAWPSGGLIGRPVEALVPPEAREGHGALRAGFMARPTTRPMGQGRELRALRRDGSSLPVEISLQAMELADGPGVVAALRDATERQRSEAALRRAQLDLEQRVAERTALLEIAKAFAATLSLPQLLDGILDQLATLIGYSGAALCGERDGRLAVLSARGGPGLLALRGQPVPASVLPLFQLVARQRRALRLADLWQGQEGPAAGLTADGNGLGSALRDAHALLLVPLLVQDRVLGLLCLDHSRPGYFTEQHASLASAVASHAAIAIDNARLYEEAGGRAVLEERQRLARELHDSVSQALYGISLGARTARRLLDRDPAAAAQPLDYVLSLAGAGLAEMKALLLELRPETLETKGLAGAIREQAAALETRHGLKADLELDAAVEGLAIPLKHTLYRVAQEALHNVLKHAQAATVTVHLARTDGRVLLRVTDDGVGFDPGQDFPGHLGLRSMRERVAQLGGRLEIRSAPQAGTVVLAELPAT